MPYSGLITYGAGRRGEHWINYQPVACISCIAKAYFCGLATPEYAGFLYARLVLISIPQIINECIELRLVLSRLLNSWTPNTKNDTDHWKS